MEYCTLRNRDEVAPQYLVMLSQNQHITEIMNVETQEIFPVWQHPKLLPFKERIMQYGLTPDIYEDGNGVVWLNTLVFDNPHCDALDVIDVTGAFNQGVRYSGIVHLNEDWKCTYSMANELGLFTEPLLALDKLAS